MNVIDVGVVIFLIFGAILGFKRGFTKELVKAVGFIVVVILSYLLKNPLSVFLYEHLPFFNLGILKGVEVLNILVYELIAFVICLAVLSIALKLLLLATTVFEKILNTTIILAIPSKIMGAVIGLLHHYVLAFVILYAVTLICIDVDIVNDSKLKDKIVYNTPILSGFVVDSTKVVNEFIALKNSYDDKSISEEQFNCDAINLFTKYEIIDEENLNNLIEKGKIQACNIGG